MFQKHPSARGKLLLLLASAFSADAALRGSRGLVESSAAPTTPTAVGGKVCYSGFIMDKLCSERGTMLDNPSLQTLQSPERHSLHCLVDVEPCYNSGFEVLAPAAAGGSGYCRAFDLGSAGTTTMLAFARAQGSCSTCTNPSGLTHGFKAKVVGTVMTPATSGAAAVLKDVRALAHGADCPEGYTETAAPVEDSSLCLATTPPTAAVTTTTTTAVAPASGGGGGGCQNAGDACSTMGSAADNMPGKHGKCAHSDPNKPDSPLYCVPDAAAVTTTTTTAPASGGGGGRSEEHTSELQSQG